MKGISTIIAAIILVVITIGLIATAYLYFAGIVSVGPVVSIGSAYCNYDKDLNKHNVTVTLRNDGTSDWGIGDLTFMWEDTEVTPVTGYTDCQSADAGDSKACVFTNGTGTMPSDITGTHTFNVYGPRNTAGGPITC